jgi:hypothetical protein
MLPPAEAVAVRTPAGVVIALGTGAVRCCHIKAAPPNINRAKISPIIRPVLDGLFGLGATISGRGACDGRGAAGAGATLIKSLRCNLYYDAKVIFAP